VPLQFTGALNFVAYRPLIHTYTCTQPFYGPLRFCRPINYKIKYSDCTATVFDISFVLYFKLWVQWYGHVLQKEDNDSVKKCVEYEVEGARPRGRPKKTWREIVEKDFQARKLNREDAIDRKRWRKQIRDD